VAEQRHAAQALQVSMNAMFVHSVFVREHERECVCF